MLHQCTDLRETQRVQQTGKSRRAASVTEFRDKASCVRLLLQIKRDVATQQGRTSGSLTIRTHVSQSDNKDARQAVSQKGRTTGNLTTMMHAVQCHSKNPRRAPFRAAAGDAEIRTLCSVLQDLRRSPFCAATAVGIRTL